MFFSPLEKRSVEGPLVTHASRQPGTPDLLLRLEDAVDELQRGGQVLLEGRLDLFGRKDEPAVLQRVGPQLDSKRRDSVFPVCPVRRVTRRSIKLRRLLGPIGRTVYTLDQLCHPLSELCHGGSIARIWDGPQSVAPWIEDQLRKAMVSDDPTEKLPGNQVSHRPRFRLGERPSSYTGRIARHVTGGVDVQRTRHVAIVAVRVHTDAVVGVVTAVLAFAGMMAAHEQQLVLGCVSLPDPQRPDRAVLQATSDLPQFRDLRLALDQLAQVVLQRFCRMIGGDRRFCSERGDMILGLDELFGRIAHLARGLLLLRPQNYVLRLHLPDIKAQGQIDQLRKVWRFRRISTNSINNV